MNARGYVGLAKGRKFGKARGYPKLTKARATQKATGYSQLAIDIEARKAKTAGQDTRAVADWEADKITKTPGPPPLSRGKRETGMAEDGSESEAKNLVVFFLGLRVALHCETMIHPFLPDCYEQMKPKNDSDGERTERR